MALDTNGFEKIPFTLVEGYGDTLVDYSTLKDFETPLTGFYRYQIVNGTAIKGVDFDSSSIFGYVYGVGNPAGSAFNQKIIPNIKVINNDKNQTNRTFDLFLFNSFTNALTFKVTYTITDTLRTAQTNSIEKWQGVENLTLTGTGAINGTGNKGDNTLTGNSGNNILDGREGNDTLIGGGGADILKGGVGNDIYVLDAQKAAGSRIEDSSGTKDVLNIAGLVRETLTKDKIGFGRDKTTLVIDLNKDGKVNLASDLAITNFFSSDTNWQQGKGFIETIGGFAGSDILKLFALNAKEIVKVGSIEHKVKLNLIGFPTGTDRDAALSKWTGQEVWIVIHGWNGSPEGNIGVLADAIRSKRGSAIVLTLDWSEAAITPRITDFAFGNGKAAQWIEPVAKVVADKLKAWGFNDGLKLNLVGHSLGSLLSGKLAKEFGEIQTITALEPPSERNILGGYDLNGDQPNKQRPESFSSVSKFSRAFVGSRSIAGNSDFAETADERILVDFNSGGATFKEEHSRVIDVFANLVAEKRPLVGNLFNLSDIKVHSEFRPKSYERETTVEPSNLVSERRRVYDGIIKANIDNLPVSFTGTRPSASLTKDEIIFGTNGADGVETAKDGPKITPLVGGEGNDILTGGAGADQFVFDLNEVFNSSKIGVDTITDFARGEDKIVLDKTTFTGFKDTPVGALNASEFATTNSANNGATLAARIIFNTVTGGLFYNPDRSISGLTGGGQFATLAGVKTLSATDFLIRS